MTYIYIITQTQKDSLINIEGIVFCPIQDINNNWILTQNEIDFVNNLETCPNELEFIKILQSSIYEPKPTINPFE